MSRLIEARKILNNVKEQLPLVSASLSASITLVFNTQMASAAGEKAIDPNTNCPTGEPPHFVLGFAALKEIIGDAMGDPLECEHGRLDNKDTNQKTSKGLAYWFAQRNAKSFTNGWDHWAEQDGVYVHWVGDEIGAPADATPVGNETGRPQTLESFISTSKLTGQLPLNQDHQVEVRTSSDTLFSLSLNPGTNQQFVNTLKENGLENRYGRIEVLTVSSPSSAPVDWETPGMTQVNLGYYRGTGVADFTPIGSFHALSVNNNKGGQDLIFFFAPNPDLKIGDPAVVRAVNDTIARRLFIALLHNGNLATSDPLLGRTDFIDLAGLDPLQISLIFAQN